MCETDTGLINVEVQVDPQDFWDIRILDHACGLFHRQFPKGFKWSKLFDDTDIRHKVKRVIGVSIFEKPPVFPESVHALLPWYKLEPWKNNELSRNYRLLDIKDRTKERAGLEFFDYNLAALKYIDKDDFLSEEGDLLREWLDLLANAHFKTRDGASRDAKLPRVQKAYHLLESKSLPEKVRREYTEAQKRRFQISHYVADEKMKSEKKAKIEFARKMLKRNKTLKEIVEDTGLTTEEIEALRRGENINNETL